MIEVLRRCWPITVMTITTLFGGGLLSGCGAGLAPDTVQATQANSLASTRPVPQWSTPKASHTGRWITDTEGRVLILHGTNMINKFPPYYPQALGFGDKDLRFLASHGINAIRLGFIWKGLEPMPGVYDDAYLDKLVELTRQVESYGMVPIFDFHQDSFNEAYNGEGFPDWMIHASSVSLGFPVGVGLEWQSFMNNDPAPDGIGVQEHLAKAWNHVAARFRNDRKVIFEPLNEPYPFAPEDVALGCLQPLGCPVSDTARLAPLYQKLLAAIRTVDTERLVYFEPWYDFAYGFRSWLPSFGDTNVGFAPHSYCPTGAAGLPVISGISPGLGCEAVFALTFENIVFHEQQTGEPTLITEFGAGGPKSNHDDVENRADQAMIGWTHWAYWSQDGGQPQTYALLMDITKGPVAGNIHEDQLNSITRPYPRAVAGTPTSWSYDTVTNNFALAYNTARANGNGAFDDASQTEIVLPALHYPDGYATQVTGGTIRSVANAPVLIVAACPGASAVQVRVTTTGVTSASCH